jgi:hypothetical protein
MDIPQGRPGQPAALETGPIRADFQARLQDLRDAAKDWGAQPEHPEGIFISTMIGTQEGFAELALSLAEALHVVVSKAQATAEEELARQRVATEETRIALRNAREAIRDMETAAQGTIQRVDGEKGKVDAALADRIAIQLIRATRADLLSRQRLLKSTIEWGRAIGIGGLMITLVLFGYVWGTWSDWGMASRIEAVGSAIERCQLTTKWTDDKGRRLCEMSDFVAN